MTVRHARSTQTVGMSWPTLAGVAGNLVTLLDALLVNGSSSVNISSITRSGAVATVNLAANHGMNATDPETMRKVFHAGLDQAEYNGEFIATVVDADTYTIPVTGTPATPATGAGTAKHPGAGWAIEYTGTNKRSYRALTGLRHYCRVADDGTGSAAYARVVGYESMTDVDTGTGPFPTAAQLSGGTYFHKSQSADATTRAWFFVGDEKRFMLFVDASAGTAVSSGIFWGEILSYRPGDAYHTFIGSTSSSTVSGTGHSMAELRAFGGAQLGHYMARPYTQTGSPVNVTKSANVSANAAAGTTTGQTVLAYPMLADGGLYVHRMFITETTVSVLIRGELPGLWQIMHDQPLTHLDTWTGTGNLANRQFLYLKTTGANNQNGAMALEISNTW